MATATDLVQTQAKNLKALLDVSKKEIEAALPRHLTADRMLRIAMTEARKTPALLECTQASFLGAIIQASQLGLEPGAALGHCWLIPFKNKNTNQKEVQFIIGYRGMLDLAGRSDRCSHVIARAVYEGDQFECVYGLEERLVHIPSDDASGPLTHVYAVVFLKDGRKIFDVMNAKEIEAVRKRSKSSDSGPWETDYEAMAKKSVIRRLFKYAPVSIEIQRAVGLDEAADRGEQDNGSVIETTGRNVPDKGAELQEKMKGEKAANPPWDAQNPAIDSDPESFNNFGTTVEPPRAKSRAELVKEILGVARDSGINQTQLESECKTLCGVTSDKANLEQLDKLLKALKQKLDAARGAVK